MFPNIKIPLMLSFLFISSCSQFENNGKQEQILEEEIVMSMTAALNGYLHFTDRCVVVNAENGEGTQLAILGNQIISNLTENTLVYQGKKYTEGDYIRVGGGYVDDSATFKKKHNLSECDGLEVFVPN